MKNCCLIFFSRKVHCSFKNKVRDRINKKLIFLPQITEKGKKLANKMVKLKKIHLTESIMEMK